ncbi:MAG TPA: hypothetical protein VNH53_10670 [Sphingomicrobium sp.]|nr:hypothetical protein [Sphingomicrobium sp.]
MRTFALIGALGAVSFGLAACEQRTADNNMAADNLAAEGAGNGVDAGTAGAATAGGEWTPGTRIVVEEGVTYRINPDGVRVRLGPADSRIEVVNGTRYRVDPGGTRVRIDEQGMAIGTVETDAIDANLNAGVNVGGDTSVGVTTNTP